MDRNSGKKRKMVQLFQLELCNPISRAAVGLLVVFVAVFSRLSRLVLAECLLVSTRTARGEPGTGTGLHCSRRRLTQSRGGLVVEWCRVMQVAWRS